MEGVSGWTILGGLAGYGLAAVSALLFVASAGIRISGQKPGAMKLFSVAMLCLAFSSVVFVVAFTSERSGWRGLMVVLAIAVTLAGVGQCGAAFRHPPCYLAAFLCSIACGGFIARPLITFGFATILRATIIGSSSFLLGAASLAIATIRLERPRNRTQILLVLALFNLMAFLMAIVNFEPGDTTVYIRPEAGFVLKDQIADLVGNTRWRWVFITTLATFLISTSIAIFQPRPTRRRIIVIYFMISAIAVQGLTALFAINPVYADVGYGPMISNNLAYNHEYRTVLPGLVRISYTVREDKDIEQEARSYTDYYVWYFVGVVRLRHTLTGVSQYHPPRRPWPDLNSPGP